MDNILIVSDKIFIVAAAASPVGFFSEPEEDEVLAPDFDVDEFVVPYIKDFSD